MRAIFKGGSLNGQEMPLPAGRRYIAATERWPDRSTRIRMREVYRRDECNGKRGPDVEGPHPDLVYTYRLESVEDYAWPVLP